MPRGLGGSRKQWTDIDVEAEIGKGRGDHLLAAVMAILPDLGNQDAGAAALVHFEFADELLHPLDGVGHGSDLPFVNAGDGFDFRTMAAEHFFQGRGDFPDRGLGARRIDRKREQIPAG